MCPGMDDKQQQKDFTRKVDELLAGRSGRASEPLPAESRVNFEFAKKVLANRTEPSLVFRDNLKQRLLAKMTEQEAAGVSTLSWWNHLRDLFSSPPLWKMAAATVAVAVVALVVWRMGVFAPEEHTMMTSQMGGAMVSVEARVADLKRAYNTGDTVALHFSFKNVTADTITFPFPPGIGIESADFRAVRFFAAGNGTVTLRPGKVEIWDLTWDQRDAAGQLVPPGDYLIVMPRIPVTEGGGMLSLNQPLTVTILPVP